MNEYEAAKYQILGFISTLDKEAQDKINTAKDKIMDLLNNELANLDEEEGAAVFSLISIEFAELVGVE